MEGEDREGEREGEGRRERELERERSSKGRGLEGERMLTLPTSAFLFSIFSRSTYKIGRYSGVPGKNLTHTMM